MWNAQPMSADSNRPPYAIIGQGSLFDGIAYWATLIGVYLMVGGLMFYSGKEKLFDDDGHPPQSIVTQFKGTWLDTFPARTPPGSPWACSSSACSRSSS
jgi:hypothetical protein